MRLEELEEEGFSVDPEEEKKFNLRGRNIAIYSKIIDNMKECAVYNLQNDQIITRYRYCRTWKR